MSDHQSLQQDLMARAQSRTMDLRTTLRELDELISRTESVLNRMLDIPFPSLSNNKQKRVRSMRTQIRRLRAQRRSITRLMPRQKIA